MNYLKRSFVVPYFLAQIVVVMHSILAIGNEGVLTAWLGALIATLPAAAVFVMIMLGYFARTSENLPLILVGGALGTVLAFTLPSVHPLPVFYASVVGLMGGVLYIFWYSRFGERDNSKLRLGTLLPDFTLYQTSGEPLHSAQIRQSPALLLFYRGNWCPLCMVQIREIAEQYRELEQRGVRVYLVSPQPQTQTRSLADKFSIPMHFLVDRDLAVAKSLNIAVDNAVPLGVSGYDADSVMPTVIISDEKGEIIFADLTDNYRVRPEPQTFLRILDQAAV